MPSKPGPSVGELYETLASTLETVARAKFGISPSDARCLMHDVFLAYMTTDATIRDPRAWLVGAICNASRVYLRRSRRFDQLEETTAPDFESGIINQIVLAEALATLRPRCRDVLRLRYLIGASIEEVADHLHTSVSYAYNVIHRCLGRANEAMKKERERFP